MTTRRDLVLGTAAASLLGVLGCADTGDDGQPVANRNGRAFKYRGSDLVPGSPETTLRQRFEATLGESYELYPNPIDVVGLRLTAIDDLGSDERLDQFALSFETTMGSAVAEGTHTLWHAALGRFALFVSPAEAGGYRSVLTQVLDPALIGS